MLYKYRSIKNTMFLLDILVNSRLFAAKFDSLNDPMEGHFRYGRSKVGRDLLKEIRSLKNELKICSLSKELNNTLMWSYYADGHKGVAIGVEIAKSDEYELIPVKYRERAAYVSKSMDSEKAVKELLTTKLLPWEHEQEVRVLTCDEFVNIEVKEIVFGKRIEDKNMKLLKQLTNKLGIKNTSKMTNSELKDFA
ncbi:DUF2971 domain-containing protein [Thermodesulfobacteriota bacterium]